MLYACIQETVMVQQSLYSLKTDTFENHKSYILSNIKKLGKVFVNKYNIEKCFQLNKTDFETQVWACSEHMLKVKPIPYIDKSNITCTLYIL